MDSSLCLCLHTGPLVRNRKSAGGWVSHFFPGSMSIIFLNAPFIFSMENEHDFVKSVFLVYSQQCSMLFSSPFFNSSLLFSRYSQYHSVHVPIYAPMAPKNHDATPGLPGPR